jgi:Asp-tRNA(Asn)/Glu-tRNA(Gln) amidotransferase A subunit family amidase
VAKWAQADHDGKTVALADAWVNDAKYLKEKGISPVTKLVIDQGELEYKFGYKDALKRKSEWKRELRRVFAEVDFIAVATLQNLPPRAPRRKSSVAFEWLVFNSQNTVGVNFAGNPALAIPIAMPERDHFIPYTSLQLIGRPFSEAQLLNAGRLLEGHP